MTDRELLEMAAKAAGLEISNGEPFEGVKGDYLLLKKCDHLVEWNPLTDDGDALRLAVQLQISINQNIIRVETGTISLSLAGTFIGEDTIKQDWVRATRRAIVRAAAEIGWSMP